MMSIATAWVAAIVALAPSPQVIVPDASMHRAISEGLAASAYAIEDLAIPLEPVMPFTVVVNLGGEVVHLDLEPSTIRSHNFVVQVPDGTGGLTTTPPPAPRTVRGVVRETGAPVGGGLVRQGLRVVVFAEDGVWSIEPLASIMPAPRERHVIVHSADEFGAFGTCPGGVPWVGDQAPINPRPQFSPRGLVRVVELRADADFELFVHNASSVDDTIADVETVMQAVNIVYERDVEVTHNLLSVLVRTTQEDDPYAGLTSPGDILDVFRTWWNANQGGQHRDLAHLFTGKEMEGSTIGLAYTGVVCNSPNFSYGLSETRYNLLLSRRTGLTAHEIGHNFSASHCNSEPPCHIMCSTINGCNGLGTPNFGPSAIDEIMTHAIGASCLEEGEGQPLQLPVVDNFTQDFLDTRTWATIDGAVIADDTVGEPSSPYTARLPQTSTLATDLIDMSGPFDEPITLQFWAQTDSIESGENLQLTYTLKGGSPTVFRTITPAPSDIDTVGTVRVILPPQAISPTTSIGFQTSGNTSDDHWSIDNVRIQEANPTSLDFFERFSSSEFDEIDWADHDGAVINTGSPDPVSAPFVLNLDRDDWIESRLTPAGSITDAQDVWVRLFLQSNNVEPSKSFRVRYRTGDGSLATAWEHKPRSTDRSSMKSINFPLPADAETDMLSIRLEALGSDPDDDWFIDNVRVESAPPMGLPIVDSFEDTDELIDPATWFPIDGAVINQGASNEPSGSNAVNLDWQDRLTTRPFDVSDTPIGDRLVVRFWLQHNNVESGKTFHIDYRRSNGSWAGHWSYASDSTERTTVGYLDIPIPPDGMHDETQIRLRAEGADGSDDWFVDDLLIETVDGLSVPVLDPFDAPMLSPLIWADDDSVAINEGALNEPSPPYAMNLDRDETATTHPIDATSFGLGLVVRFWVQHNGVEPGKDLFVEYTDAGGSWRIAETLTSADAARTTFGFVNVPLGTNAQHGALQIRLRVNGDDGSDDWFIDDLEIAAFNGFDTPIDEMWMTNRLDPVLWVPIVSTPVINQGANNEPSPPFVLNIDNGEVLETGFINGQTMAQSPTLSFWMQHNGVEPGETLTIDWRTNATIWTNLITLVSKSASRTPGEFLVFDLPQTVATNTLRFRFSVSGDEPNDDWFLDDIHIGNRSMLLAPFAEDFESAQALGLRNWSSSSAFVTQAATGEPSGQYSLGLFAGDNAVALPMRLGDVDAPYFARFWCQHTGPVTGGEIIFSVTDSSGSRHDLVAVPATAVNAAPFTMFEVELPAFALHNDARFEFRSPTGGIGVFFVDDFQVDGDELTADCPPDFSGDGMVDFFDVQLFLNAFAARDPVADLNNDSLFDFFDVLIYLGLFDDGCP